MESGAKIDAPRLDPILLNLALREDIADGDVTTDSLISAGRTARAYIFAKEPLVVCGHSIAEQVFRTLDPGFRYTVLREEGSEAAAGEKICSLEGELRAILTGERTALNFIQHLSAIATKTRAYVRLVPGVKVRDTRKTIPGLRALEKYAVHVGGGDNHRFGLFDAVLIKNNHIDAIGGDIVGAIAKTRAAKKRVHVEVRDERELRAAVSCKPDSILLDNMSPDVLRSMVRLVRSELSSDVELEASGGVTDATIREIAATGVDAISIGALTHSVRAMDLSLRMEKSGGEGRR